MQTTITTAELEPDERTKQAAQQQLKGDNYKQWSENVRFMKLTATIWEPIQNQFIKERGITVSGNEVDSFFEYSERARKLQQQQLQQALQQLNTQMRSGKLSAQEKEQGEQLKKQFEQQLAAVSKQLPKPSQQEKEVAERLIKNWKVNQLLYKQYGGQVIATASSPFEPVGAYKKFLEEKEKQKVFEITDPTYKKRFWEVFTPGKDAPIVPQDKVDFSKPWWVLMVEKGQAAMNTKK